MKSTTLRWLLIGLLLLATGSAHAENGCPPGLIPASGTNINSCVPIPQGYYNNQKRVQPVPPPRWADRWGAIATYESNGSLGFSTNMTNKSEAELTALADCQSKHGSTCKLEVAYSNGCGALIGSDTGYVVTTDATLSGAIQSGMQTCENSGYSNCHSHYSDCSLPVLIQ